MGRRKIEIKPITEERNRSVTFIKRKGGLFKKAHELAVLCQVELALVVITPDRKVHEYCTSPHVEDIVQSCQKYPVVEHKGLQDYSARYMGASSHDADEDGHEEATLEDSDGEPEEVHLKKDAERHNVKIQQILDEDGADRPGLADSRPGSRPRLKVQIPQIPPPVATPEPHVGIKQEREADAAMNRAPQAAGALAAATESPGAHHASDATNGNPGPLNSELPSQILDADKAARAPAQAGQPQHPQVMFPPRLNTNVNRGGLPHSPGGYVAPGYPPYMPYAGYFNNYPVGYGYPAPPSALPGGSGKASGGTAGASARGGPLSARPGPSQGPPPSAAMNQGTPTLGGQRVGGAPGLSATGSAGGGRWSAYPQSPMAYFLPAPVSGGDTSQSKLEPGAISAAMPTRYMNEMLASPSNYFSMEWGVWDPQESAGPGGTARVSPPSAQVQASNGTHTGAGETAISSPLQFVPVPGNERKRTAADESSVPKWRPKQ